MRAIHALSSGPVPAGVAVIRLSGTDVFRIAEDFLGVGKLPPPRTAMLRSIFAANSSEVIDKSIIIKFPGPHSFTGEDVLEIHCHGGLAVVSAILQLLSDLGSRPAEAGEFTRRAFLNGRMDLLEAEALSDLLAAETELQRRYAMSREQGGLRSRTEAWRQQILLLLSAMEAELDFSDEADVSELQTEHLNAQIAALSGELHQAMGRAMVAERIRHGLVVAIVGPPNAGKSSLLNALARRDVAIVTPHAGTTRDILEVHLDLGGRAAILLDTAGLRETSDPIEAEGIARARARMAEADYCLDLGPDGNVVNKIDELGFEAGYRDGKFHISALTGAGLADLEQHLADWARDTLPAEEFPLLANERQRKTVEDAQSALDEAVQQTDLVLKAESLRLAITAFDRLSGRVDPEEVLDNIFSRFCIGK